MSILAPLEVVYVLTSHIHVKELHQVLGCQISIKVFRSLALARFDHQHISSIITTGRPRLYHFQHHWHHWALRTLLSFMLDFGLWGTSNNAPFLTALLMTRLGARDGKRFRESEVMSHQLQVQVAPEAVLRFSIPKFMWYPRPLTSPRSRNLHSRKSKQARVIDQPLTWPGLPFPQLSLPTHPYQREAVSSPKRAPKRCHPAWYVNIFPTRLNLSRVCANLLLPFSPRHSLWLGGRASYQPCWMPYSHARRLKHPPMTRNQVMSPYNATHPTLWIHRLRRTGAGSAQILHSPAKTVSSISIVIILFIVLSIGLTAILQRSRSRTWAWRSILDTADSRVRMHLRM